jgi:Mrp family chromosome partitioning ATPase
MANPMIATEAERTIDEWRLALDGAAMAAEGEARGRIPYDWSFVESCRKAFLSLSPRLGVGAVIAVVSPHRGEGRPAIGAGLALGIARYGEASVGLLDLDLDHPGQAQIFSVNPQPGLAEYLRERRRLRAVRISARPRLWLLPAGAPRADGTWLLRAPAIGSLLSACRERFGWTVVDLPPLLEPAGAGPLLGLADAYVLVGQHRKTTMAAIQQAGRLLPVDRPAGFVMIRSGGPRGEARRQRRLPQVLRGIKRAQHATH